MEKNIENKAVKNVAKKSVATELYCFTEYGITVEATSREEAEAKLKEILAKTK